MIINQLLPAMSYGDAVSNSAINMKVAMEKMGIKSKIYAEHIHPKVSHLVQPAHSIPKDQPLIYHLAIGCDLAYEIPKFTDKRMLLYHNITPSHYFRGYDDQSADLCDKGRKELLFLKDFIDIAFADSAYNKAELDEVGYSNTHVTPIIINYEDYDGKYNAALFKKLQQSKIGTDFLFVGRLAPNKKQEDIIKTFYIYKTYFDKDARLHLVGSYTRMEKYYEQLKGLIKELQLEDVHLTGHIPFGDILSYYRNADMFLNMSEHEGFCVPILEAMKFQIPIVAYKEAAVPETLGNGGILFMDKEYSSVASLIKVMVDDHELREKILMNQKRRLEYFSKENTTEIFMSKLKGEMAAVK
ncbi:glycosyltransferase [Paenibacillus sp. 453mf]|uniref:glycosyltransferase family 4 protein n=1 Tax=Paenibacillus sp. 453mf TaxID=1761874 RepID=UPI0008E61D0D|nr:glycosyltransferase [Paenibacillus sp. 453mf]SFS84553.1 Glycosyltransferase involved in cell wall bisynthesis [Paenibacillus sp. 453mf]